jgi:hypothetical protein
MRGPRLAPPAPLAGTLQPRPNSDVLALTTRAPQSEWINVLRAPRPRRGGGRYTPHVSTWGALVQLIGERK